MPGPPAATNELGGARASNAAGRDEFGTILT